MEQDVGGREQTSEEGQGLAVSQVRLRGQPGHLGAEKEAGGSQLVSCRHGLCRSWSQHGDFPMLGTGQAGVGRGVGGVLGPSEHSLLYQGHGMQMEQVETYRSGLDPWLSYLVILSFTQQILIEHLLYA